MSEWVKRTKRVERIKWADMTHRAKKGVYPDV